MGTWIQSAAWVAVLGLVRLSDLDAVVAYSGLTEVDLGSMFDALKALPPVKNAAVGHTP